LYVGHSGKVNMFQIFGTVHSQITMITGSLGKRFGFVADKARGSQIHVYLG
jgi:hypothetical protein